MSLRFDRKGSVRSRKRDRQPNNGNNSGEYDPSKQREYFMSWTYRQCQFACDYLNLMDHTPGGTLPISELAATGPETGSNLETGSVAMGPPSMPSMPTATIGSLNRKSGSLSRHSSLLLGAPDRGIESSTATAGKPNNKNNNATKLQLNEVINEDVSAVVEAEGDTLNLPGNFSRAGRFGSFHRASELSSTMSSTMSSISTGGPRMRASIAGCSRSSFASNLVPNSNSTATANAPRNSFQFQRQSSYAESVCSSQSNGTLSSRSSSYGFDFERDMDTKPVDPFRFSQATLEDTREDELDAILGELSALQMSLDQEIINKQPNLLQVPGSDNNIRDRDNATAKTNGGNSGGNTTNANDNGVRTESPDNDSGFSDNASLLSSGSSLSASGSSSGSSTTSCAIKNNIPPSTVLHANELAALVSAKLECVQSQNGISDEKAEKIKEALAKMRAASVTRLYVKAFSPDGSSKALMVEESMSCGRVLALLADKNHVPLSHKWALVEHIPHLHMERIYEDHENMVENLLMWTRDSKNKIYFVERDEKYDMFVNPQRYFLESRLSHGAPSMDEHTKNSLIDEFFNQGVGVPDVESTLYLKAEGKKAWKKFIFVLRASGIYYYPKGRLHANSSKDLVCLATLDPNQQAYQGIGWKKKFKSPTEFGFVLKPARLQVKSHRHMKYLCAEDSETLKLWMVGLRIAKNKRQIWDNYRSLLEDIAHEDLDRFGRSVSLASMPIQINTKDSESCIKIMSLQPQNGENIYAPSNQHIRSTALANNNMRLENSMGQHINLVQSSTPSTFTREEAVGFESDCPVGGTIKRKPSTVLQPKIPLTIKTRSIVGDFINVVSSNDVNSGALTHTLQRRRSSSGSGNSTASSNSSLSSINSQPGMLNGIQSSQLQAQTAGSGVGPQSVQSVIHNNNNTNNNNRPQFQGKPPLSTPPMRKPTPTNPSPLVEEIENIDFEDLPPPPPELLLGGDSVDSHISQNHMETLSNNNNNLNNSFNDFGGPPPPPPPPVQPTNNMPPPPPPAPKQSTNSPTPYNPRSSNSATLPGNAGGREPKGGKKGVTFASELTQRLQSRKNTLNSTTSTSNSDNNTVLSNQTQNQIHNHNQPTNTHYNQGKFSSLPPPSLNRSNSLSNDPNSVGNSAKKLEDPPQDFLSDLQRVMQKKWQVAQKCGSDRNTNPQEILGFRMPEIGEGGEAEVGEVNGTTNPGTPSSVRTSQTNAGSATGTPSGTGEQITENSLNNVRAWVSQHYGNSADELPPLQMQQIVGAAANIVAQQQLQQKQQQLQQQIQQQSQFPPPPSPQQLQMQIQYPTSPTQHSKPIPPMKPIRTESILSMTNLPPPPSPADMDSALGGMQGHGHSQGYGQGHVIYGHTHIMQQHRNQSDMLPPPPPSSQSQMSGNGGVVIYENFQGRKSSQANNMMMGQYEYSAVQVRNKKPPPPIPKRAESTHLSAHIVFN